MEEYDKKCESCMLSELVRDQAGEFYLCHNVQKECEPVHKAKMKCSLIAYTPNPMDVVELAASMCYDSKPTKDHRIAKACLKSGHSSVFEHVMFTFQVEGVSRALLAQLTRHRNTAFSVRSQRYCVEDGCKYVMPKTLNPLDYGSILQEINAEYAAMIDDGIPAEDARFILPNGAETKLVVSMNGRELIQASALRLCARAQWEIRELFQMMRAEVAKNVDPEYADFLRPSCERNAPYNFCTERESCGRHPTLNEVYNTYEESLSNRGEEWFW